MCVDEAIYHINGEREQAHRVRVRKSMGGNYRSVRKQVKCKTISSERGQTTRTHAQWHFFASQPAGEREREK